MVPWSGDDGPHDDAISIGEPASRSGSREPASVSWSSAPVPAAAQYTAVLLIKVTVAGPRPPDPPTSVELAIDSTLFW